ncbi:MAG: M23 family metallopeptidase [Spirochaetales bacterium]
MKKMDPGFGGILILLILVLFFTLSLSAPAEEFLKHTLVEGETLYSLARQYKIPLDSLLKANNITDPTKVRVGTSILIPQVYIIQKGDTLYGIARKFGVKLQHLLEANSLAAEGVIKPGNTLYIPSPISSSTQSTPASTPPTRDTPSPSIEVAKNTEKTNPTLVSAPRGNALISPPTLTEKTLPHPFWPHPGNRVELTGKLEGISFRGKAGDPVYSISSGKVAWVGPYRGFGRVVIVQSDQGYLYVYAGNETIHVEPGELIQRGQKIGTLGVNPYNQASDLYFLVYKDGKPIPPEEAPRI